MNRFKASGVVVGSFFILNTSAYAEPGVSVKLGFSRTDITLEATSDRSNSEVSDDYLGVELGGTLSLDQIYISGEVKTSTDDEVELDVFSLLGGYRLNDQASVFLGYKSLDYVDSLTSDGFFAGYSYLIPIEAVGSALVFSGALGVLTAELDGVSGVDSDPALGYNLKASYLYSLNDKLTISGDLAHYSYTYKFEGPGGKAEINESNLAYGVSVLYAIQ